MAPGELKEQTKVGIANGPNRWGLIMDALVYGKTVEFLIDDVGGDPIIILKVNAKVRTVSNIVPTAADEQSDRSDGWRIHGHLDFFCGTKPKDQEIEDKKRFCESLGLVYNSFDEFIYFYGAYDTHIRKGWLTITNEWKNALDYR